MTNINIFKINNYSSGLDFGDMTLPDQQTPAGNAMMTGSLYWYNDTSIPPYWYPQKFYTTFAEFTRRSLSLILAVTYTLIKIPGTAPQ